MNTLKVCAAAIVVLCSAGCAGQLATGAGVSFSEDRPTHGKWFGNATAGFVGSSDTSVRIGMELDGRHEFEHGTTWHVGGQFGVIKNPGASSPVGGSLHLDFGTPLTEPTLFPGGDFYAGMTAEMLIWLGGERGPSELNASPWLLVSQPELVFLGRGRSHHHFDDDPTIGHVYTIDVEGGVGMRIRFISEYF